MLWSISTMEYQYSEKEGSISTMEYHFSEEEESISTLEYLYYGASVF